MREIRCVHRCKGFMDCEFCDVFSWYCEHPRVF